MKNLRSDQSAGFDSNDNAPIENADPLMAWDAIKRELSQQRDQVYEEIKTYPPPIPACDQQYNHLLEQRARINRELTQLERAMRASASAQEHIEEIERFLRSSECIDADTANAIRAVLKGRRREDTDPLC